MLPPILLIKSVTRGVTYRSTISFILDVTKSVTILVHSNIPIIKRTNLLRKIKAIYKSVANLTTFVLIKSYEG